MWPLLQLFIDIALHRRGPEDVPSSAALLWLVLGTATVVQLLSLLGLDYAAGRAALETVLHLALTLGAYAVVLTARGLTARLPQTLTALLGTATLLGVLMLPLVTWMYAGMQIDQVSPLATLGFFVLLIWSIDITGFVLSRALGTHYVIGVLVALGVIALDATLRRAILPAL